MANDGLAVPRVFSRLVIPPGWLLLPVRNRSFAELKRLIKTQYADLPRDSAGPHLAQLVDQVVDAMSPTREAQVIDALMPLRNVASSRHKALRNIADTITSSWQTVREYGQRVK